jgi:hypothetical protein
MVRREVTPGAALVARWTEGDDGPDTAGVAHERRVDVAALPFAVS